MDHVVGFGGSIHDFATCLISSDGTVVAIEDERLSRVRYAYGEPYPCRRSLEIVLAQQGLDTRDVGRFAANDMLVDELKLPGVAPDWLNHHYTHAASGLFTSPFDEAAILVADGAGSVVDEEAELDAGRHQRETTTWAMGRGNDIEVLGRVVGSKRGGPGSNDADALMSNSLGDFYRAVTEAIGFGFLQAGKTMGLAAYGDDRFVDRLMTAVKLLPGGQFTVRTEGPGGVLDLLAGIPRGRLADDFEGNAHLAAAGQAVLERILLHILAELWRRTRCPNLCLAGGVALNCVFNGKIVELTPFENVHVIHAPGDSGTAIGAAVGGRLAGTVGEQPWRLTASPYLGLSYPDSTLDGYGDLLTDDELCRRVAGLLHQGGVVAWFQGAAEFGPRALGNRSLLADPSRPGMRDLLNQIKQREWFRPVAPVVLENRVDDFFHAYGTSPAMQFSWSVKESARQSVPAICHIDGSARVQTVSDAQNPALAALIGEFERQGGPPVLVNTSLNLRGEPIVETPDEALAVLAQSDIDALVVGNRLIRK
ncbi:carbamoyltransferase [Sphaerisporangium viridialbum]|uniref:carbamoyltransferase family protein n=1 Tax=Sphaerisporangium viridialbum TaxID=46189 RepID=UPI003C72B731